MLLRICSWLELDAPRFQTLSLVANPGTSFFEFYEIWVALASTGREDPITKDGYRETGKCEYIFLPTIRGNRLWSIDTRLGCCWMVGTLHTNQDTGNPAPPIYADQEELPNLWVQTGKYTCMNIPDLGTRSRRQGHPLVVEKNHDISACLFRPPRGVHKALRPAKFSGQSLGFS